MGSVFSYHECQQKDTTLHYTESQLLLTELSWLVQAHIFALQHRVPTFHMNTLPQTHTTAIQILLLATMNDS